MLTDTQYEDLKWIKDYLTFQLTKEDIDWVYFIETALRAKDIEDNKLVVKGYEDEM